MAEYYDGTKLLSKKDLSGRKPEVYICTTNRTGGKSTYFGRLNVNKFLKTGSKFGLIYRFKYEVDNVSDKFFKDIKNLFFPGHTMTDKSMNNGIYHELFLDEISCGYAFALTSSEQIKKNSHLFSDIDRLLFDEFQSETNHYASDEVGRLLSIHTSIARGNHEQVRYVPLYMLSNTVSIINPYFCAMGISERLQTDTKFLKGDGFVLEQGYIESAAKAQRESGFNRAFSSNKYVAYASENVYLNDNMSFVEKPDGVGKYLATLKYKGKSYAIREYGKEGIIYCDDHADETYRLKISVTTEDHAVNYVMLKRNDFFLNSLRFFFEKGCFRFKDLRCKEAVLKALSY